MEKKEWMEDPNEFYICICIHYTYYKYVNHIHKPYQSCKPLLACRMLSMMDKDPVAKARYDKIFCPGKFNSFVQLTNSN